VSESSLTPEQAAKAVVDGIQKQGGKFICSDSKVFIIINGRRIEISPAFENRAYAALQLKYSNVATAEYKGKAVCQRVAVIASQGATDMRLASFSAVSRDKKRLYIPIEGGELLQITASGLERVSNGANQDACGWNTRRTIRSSFCRIAKCEMHSAYLKNCAWNRRRAAWENTGGSWQCTRDYCRTFGPVPQLGCWFSISAHRSTGKLVERRGLQNYME
jgi:hypothetical protein